MDSIRFFCMTREPLCYSLIDDKLLVLANWCDIRGINHFRTCHWKINFGVVTVALLRVRLDHTTPLLILYSSMSLFFSLFNSSFRGNTFTSFFFFLNIWSNITHSDLTLCILTPYNLFHSLQIFWFTSGLWSHEISFLIFFLLTNIFNIQLHFRHLHIFLS